MGVIDLIRSDNYLILNRVFIWELGLNPAILLCELANQSAHFDKDNKLETFNDEEGYFFEKISEMELRTGLSRKEQDTALKVLRDRGLIKSLVKGLPAKRYFKIDEDKAIELFLKSKSRMSEKGKVEGRKKTEYDVEKRQAGLIIEENKKENKLREKTTQKIPLQKFGKFVELLPEDYEKFCKEHTKLVIDDLIERMNDYLEAHGGVYKSYAAALRTWIKNQKQNPQKGGPLSQEDLIKKNKDFLSKMRSEFQGPQGIVWDNPPGKVRFEQNRGASTWTEEISLLDTKFQTLLESAMRKRGFYKNV